MADLLAKQDLKSISHHRGQEVEGEIISILESDIIIDLGTKAEGVLSKKDLSPEQIANLKVGDKLITFVVHPETESGQVILGLQKAIAKGNNSARWNKFSQAQKSNQVLSGKGLEVNKGGVIVEVSGIRGFLPSSQVALAQASNLDSLVGQDINVTVIEVDPGQNRLIFSQKTTVSDDTKKKLSKLKVGDQVKGKVAAVLQFGIFVALEDGVEGLVHVSEVSWEKVEDLNSVFKVGDEVEAKVVAVDANTGRVNLSIRQLQKDPFVAAADKYQPDDVIKATISKVTSMGVTFALDGGIEGLMASSKMDPDTKYEVGESVSCLVDSIDTQRRRVNLVPFITSTKDLIYK